MKTGTTLHLFSQMQILLQFHHFFESLIVAVQYFLFLFQTTQLPAVPPDFADIPDLLPDN